MWGNSNSNYGELLLPTKINPLENLTHEILWPRKFVRLRYMYTYTCTCTWLNEAHDWQLYVHMYVCHVSSQVPRSQMGLPTKNSKLHPLNNSKQNLADINFGSILTNCCLSTKFHSRSTFVAIRYAAKVLITYACSHTFWADLKLVEGLSDAARAAWNLEHLWIEPGQVKDILG